MTGKIQIFKQTEFLKLKTTITKMTNLLDGLTIRLLGQMTGLVYLRIKIVIRE